MNLLVAGSDTSSSALAATFFYLSRNRDAYSKVAAEVRTAFKSRYEIRAGTLLNGCVYLRAAINGSRSGVRLRVEGLQSQANMYRLGLTWGLGSTRSITTPPLSLPHIATTSIAGSLNRTKMKRRKE
jgi:hypothetical protein